MKVKTINRNEDDYTRERSQDLQKVFRNYDPNLHQFEKAHEYNRALNAAKLDRVFAKPFVAAFQHDDGITTLARNPKVLNSLISGTADGLVRIWDVPRKRCLRQLVGHTGPVKGVSFAADGETCVSASVDCTVKLWKVPYAPFEAGEVQADAAPALEFQGKSSFRGIDHHWSKHLFATCGNTVEVWDHSRSEPVNSFTWGADSILSLRFNPAEADVFATTGSDRGIVLYDLRSSAPARKLVMQTRSNTVAWNPMEALHFTVANEDCNLYTYDMRKLQAALTVHKDFVSAVMDVDYSPTGREFVAGSYDRSVRIFAHNGRNSREVYTAKRMQRVFSVRFSGDATYVFSGSDDMNVRVWKAQASQQLGTLLSREQHKQAYQQALLERYNHLPEVRRITRHRHLPASIYKAQKLRREVLEKEEVHLKNRIKHSKPGSVKVKPERKKKIVAEVD